MSVSPIPLFLVDADPVFRMGLRIWLSQRSEFVVLGEAATSQDALTQLATLQQAASDSATDAGSAASSPRVQIVVVDLGIGQDNPDTLPGLSLCGVLKQQFPDLAILVLAETDAPVLREAARHMGADGFGLRHLPTSELGRLIQRVAIAASPLAPLPEEAKELSYPPPTEGPLSYLRRTALADIDTAIADIEQTAQQRLPYWYRLVLAGKYRELRAARWVVERVYGQILSPPRPPKPATAASRPPDSLTTPSSPLPLVNEGFGDPLLPATSTRVPGGDLATLSRPSPLVAAAVRSRVCEAVFRKLQFPLDNRSDSPLEIDILRPEKARELLYTVLKTFETLLDDLQQAQVPPGQLPDKSPAFLHDLWEAVTLDFFGRYYTPPVDGLDQPMVSFLQQDGEIVQSAILDPIPQVPTLLAHLLYQVSLDIDGATVVATAPDALRRSQYLLENLVITVGCAVMQPVLNRYADEESIKRSLYNRRMVSSRDIVRFRNDLSWRYRWDALINEPKAIFESEHRLFLLTPDGIRPHRIYAPRQTELESLSGLQYVVTLAMEARDAIAPRLRSALSLVGSGVIFVLTEVIGRGIGLIGRGVAKGVGNTWQDIRYRQR